MSNNNDVTGCWLTVVIATYNRKALVTSAIDSVLASGTDGVEIIVVDDASTDGTVDMLRARYAEAPAVRVVRAAVNGGPSRARNIALAQARGRWFLPLDSDCELVPGGLDLIRRECDAAPDTLLFFSCRSWPAGQRLDVMVGRGSIAHDDLLLRRTSGELWPVVPLMPLRQHALAYPPLRCGAESLLWMRLSRHIPAVFTDTILVNYRTDSEGRLCGPEQQLRSSACLALAALTHANLLRQEGHGGTAAFRNRVTAAGVYLLLSGRRARARRVLWSVARRGHAAAAALLPLSVFSSKLLARLFLSYRSRA